jgi:hypothetical protein
LVAALERAAPIGELPDGACANVLTAPVSAALLGNALHALPLNQPVAAHSAAAEAIP